MTARVRDRLTSTLAHVGRIIDQLSSAGDTPFLVDMKVLRDELNDVLENSGPGAQELGEQLGSAVSGAARQERDGERICNSKRRAEWDSVLHAEWEARMSIPSVKYAKEALTITCEELTKKAADMLDWGQFAETSGSLTQVERDCLEQLLPQVRIAAEIFRQCSKNKEENDGEVS